MLARDEPIANALPLGISGFCAAPKTALPAVNSKLFRAACFAVARDAHGTLIHFDGSAQRGRNYYFARIALATEMTHVLCNAHLPLLAFCDAAISTDLSKRVFTYVSFLAALFGTHGFDALSIEMLNQPLTAALVARLDDAERKHIRLHKPDTAGAVIFNDWG